MGQRRSPGGIGREAEFPAQARLRPGRGGALARAAGPRVAGPVALLWAEIAEQ